MICDKIVVFFIVFVIQQPYVAKIPHLYSACQVFQGFFCLCHGKCFFRRRIFYFRGRVWKFRRGVWVEELGKDFRFQISVSFSGYGVVLRYFIIYIIFFLSEVGGVRFLTEI